MHRRLLAIGFALLSTIAFGQISFAQSNSTNQQQQGRIIPKQQLTPAQLQALQNAYKPHTPPGFPLNAQEQDYVERVLMHWQQQSSKVKRSTADFRCWDYDPAHCNYRDPSNNKLAAFQIQDGQLRFGAPDKAHYEVNKIWTFEQVKNEQGQMVPNYKPNESKSVHDKWICDGKSVYQYDFEEKKLYETPIPKEMQGANITHSPLPFFLFGANKDLMLSRYWIRNVTPQHAKNEVWLEAYPKRPEDAGNYKKLEIILSLDDFLPRSLHLYSPVYDPVRNPQSRAFAFENRKVNDQLTAISKFFGLFVRPHKPIGWDWVERKAPTNNANAQNPANNGKIR